MPLDFSSTQASPVQHGWRGTPMVQTGGGGEGPPLITNVQKLSLDPASPTDGSTKAAVSNAFYVSGGATANAIGFYVDSGSEHNENPVYNRIPYDINGDGFWTHFLVNDDGFWEWRDTSDSSVVANNITSNPWDAATEFDLNFSGATLTHPALQQLAAASTAMGGVFVAGGTQDGVYSQFGLFNTKKLFLLLGNTDDSSSKSIKWEDEVGPDVLPGFVIRDTIGDALYYSLSDVATPDLATDWKNASDDSPASISVSSVTQGEMVAGLRIGTDTFVVNGSELGRNKYYDVLGLQEYYRWNGSQWKQAHGSSINGGNVAFPFDGTPEITVTRDDVAAEANWVEAA